MKDYNTYNDSELLPLLREKKPACDNAFYVLYNRYSSKVNGYCRFKLNNREASEEIFQETWLKFDGAVKAGKQIENVPAYLITIARNLCLNYFNSVNSQPDFVSGIENIEFNQLSGQFSIENNLENSELITIIKVAVNNLDDIYKESFILRNFNELSYPEIGKICNETSDCIKKRVRRATEMLKDILKPYINELSN